MAVESIYLAMMRTIGGGMDKCIIYTQKLLFM